MPVDRISAPLLAWYDANARVLPWRIPPGERRRPDPYHIWLSEIMLQQTNVTAAAPYFLHFTERWPTVVDLAATPESDVMAAWAGLGYYSRARNLVAASRILAAEGFPCTEAGLRALPGVGPYTAAAIAAIAFGQPCVAVDANVERVAGRLFAIEEPLPAARDVVRRELSPHVPADRPGDFAQALMDLGSRICTPRRPDCAACPLSRACAAYAAGIPEAFPVKPAARARPVRHGHVWWIEHDDAIAVLRRPPKGLLGGMLGLPGCPWEAARTEFSPPFPARWQAGGEVRHVFTHFELTLTIHAARPGARPATIGDTAPLWMPRDEILACGLPTLFRKVADKMLVPNPQHSLELSC